jgi:hypothetical protein
LIPPTETNVVLHFVAFFFIIHSYNLNWTNRERTFFFVECLISITHNKSRVIFIYPADNWLFYTYMRVRRMAWSWLTGCLNKTCVDHLTSYSFSTVKLVIFELDCALPILLSSYIIDETFSFLLTSNKQNWQQQKTNVHSSDAPIYRSPLSVLL